MHNEIQVTRLIAPKNIWLYFGCGMKKWFKRRKQCIMRSKSFNWLLLKTYCIFIYIVYLLNCKQLILISTKWKPNNLSICNFCSSNTFMFTWWKDLFISTFGVDLIIPFPNTKIEVSKASNVRLCYIAH